MTNRLLFALAGLAILAPITAYAGWFSKEELPPPNARPLSAVIKSLEDQGFKSIEQVGFEHGVWEVEVHQGDKEVEFHIDPMSGKIVKRE